MAFRCSTRVRRSTIASVETASHLYASTAIALASAVEACKRIIDRTLGREVVDEPAGRHRRELIPRHRAERSPCAPEVPTCPVALDRRGSRLPDHQTLGLGGSGSELAQDVRGR